MLILGRDRLKDPSLGYARTFLRQVEDCLGLALERGVQDRHQRRRPQPGRAGRRGCARSPTGSASTPQVAHVEGDDLLDRADALGLGGQPLTANAYLGAFGIAAASRPAPTWWSPAGSPTPPGGRAGRSPGSAGRPTTYDELAGAVVAGHVLECGAQATGGNFSGFTSPDGRGRSGFPLAEIAADGSCVITKHAGTGGAVTVDTVTAQLVYEIQSRDLPRPRRRRPTWTRSRSRTDGPDRVRVSGVPRLAAAGHAEGLRQRARRLPQPGRAGAGRAGHRGRRRPGSAAQLTAALARRPAGVVEWTLARTDHEDADTEEAASCRLRVTVRDADPARVGKAFTAAAGRAGAGVVPGLHADRAARRPRPRTASTAPAYVAAGRRARARCVLPPTATAGSPRRSARRADAAGHPLARPSPAAEPQPGVAGAPGSPSEPTAAGAARRRWCTRARATRAATPTSASGPATAAAAGPGGLAARLPDRRPGAASCCRRPATWRSRCTRCRTSRGQRRGPRAARRGRGRVDPVRPAGQGARRVAALAARRRPGGAAVTGFWTDEQAALQDAARAFVRRRGGAAPAGLGGRRRGAARAAPHGGEARAARARRPRGGRRRRRRRSSTRWP